MKKKNRIVSIILILFSIAYPILLIFLYCMFYSVFKPIYYAIEQKFRLPQIVAMMLIHFAPAIVSLWFIPFENKNYIYIKRLSLIFAYLIIMVPVALLFGYAAYGYFNKNYAPL